MNTEPGPWISLAEAMGCLVIGAILGFIAERGLKDLRSRVAGEARCEFEAFMSGGCDGNTSTSR
jgi:hypothetical protein